MTQTEQQATVPTSTGTGAVVVPEKPALEGLEEKWTARWREDQTYKFDRSQPRDNVAEAGDFGLAVVVVHRGAQDLVQTSILHIEPRR